MAIQPTHMAYAQWQFAYDFYNEKLFEGKLPQALITFHRNPRSMGYFSAARFASAAGEKLDEIALNVAIFALVPTEETLSTLVHEQCHQYVHWFDEPPRVGYHCKRFSDVMEKAGLITSSNGAPGGKRVGEKMSHYIASGGAFELATSELKDKFGEITWFDRYVPSNPAAYERRYQEMKAAGFNTSMGHVPGVRLATQLELQIPGEQIPKDLAPRKKKTSQLEKAKPSGLTNGHVFAGNGYLDEADAKDEDFPQVVVLTAPLSKATRRRYECRGCGTFVWGKRGLNIKCEDCGQKFIDPAN